MADKVDRFMRYYEAMNSDEVSAWIQRNVTPAMAGKSNGSGTLSVLQPRLPYFC
jgi:hypothetical protein